MNKLKEYTEKLFEDIKHIDENGNEYWLARELQNVLGYHQWRSINDLIERAKAACQETTLFIVGCITMWGAISSIAGGSNVFGFILVSLVTFNFFIELAVNLLVAPAIFRVVRAFDRSYSEDE